MIVNTAYPFMIAKTPAANPNLFENGVSSYQTAFNKASLDASGLTMQASGQADFYNIPLSKFQILNFSGCGTRFSQSPVYIAILNASGTPVHTTSFFQLNSVNQGVSTYAYTIPEQYRKDGYGIRFMTTSVQATIYSASFST